MPVLPVDKPLGPSSHDVVAEARRRLGTRRVGHAGTLDPLATGVLVLLTGGATKLSPYLTGGDKEYLAWIAFGAATATLDAEGPVVAEGDASWLTGEAVAAALPPFLTLREQRPPAFSAVKREGVRSYRRARQGEEVSLPPRPAGYLSLALVGFAPVREALPARFAADADGVWAPADSGYAPSLPPTLAALPTALVRARVRAGTYLRAFARDLGAALGVPAHLAGLVRTRAGRIGLDRACSLSDLAGAGGMPASEALAYPCIRLDAEAARRVRLGQRPPASFQGRVGLLDPDGRLAAVAEAAAGHVRLLRVWTEDEAD
ncbi:MAG TPA: tRNA pseudouridine(55) synthase TruB [Trueperaceae bacterium]|nr:tRNA pseudouridine(55) synthase TruB [Trueperaceae bacterium]